MIKPRQSSVIIFLNIGYVSLKSSYWSALKAIDKLKFGNNLVKK